MYDFFFFKSISSFLQQLLGRWAALKKLRNFLSNPFLGRHQQQNFITKIEFIHNLRKRQHQNPEFEFGYKPGEIPKKKKKHLQKNTFAFKRG
jgi:hypothetical protein